MNKKEKRSIIKGFLNQLQQSKGDEFTYSDAISLLEDIYPIETKLGSPKTKIEISYDKLCDAEKDGFWLYVIRCGGRDAFQYASLVICLKEMGVIKYQQRSDRALYNFLTEYGGSLKYTHKYLTPKQIKEWNCFLSMPSFQQFNKQMKRIRDDEEYKIDEEHRVYKKTAKEADIKHIRKCIDEFHSLCKSYKDNNQEFESFIDFVEYKALYERMIKLG